MLQYWEYYIAKVWYAGKLQRVTRGQNNAERSPNGNTVSKSVPKPDATAAVSGGVTYGDENDVPPQLVGRGVLSWTARMKALPSHAACQQTS